MEVKVTADETLMDEIRIRSGKTSDQDIFNEAFSIYKFLLEKEADNYQLFLIPNEEIDSDIESDRPKIQFSLNG